MALLKKTWKLYADQKQIVRDLTKSLKRTSKTDRRYLQIYQPKQPVNSVRHVMIIMDCVYFKRVCVYLVIRDWYTHTNIYKKRILYETIGAYVEAITVLDTQGFIIDGIVVDGRRGIFQSLSPRYPIQMCQFHQKQIIKKYLTSNPETASAIELQEVVRQLTSSAREWFETVLDVWYFKYESFVKERTINRVTKRWFYTHKRLRSAYRSLKNNLPYLFTYQKVKTMPNTTNSLDGFFSHLKDGVRIHRGLKLHRKTKLIEYLIEH